MKPPDTRAVNAHFLAPEAQRLADFLAQLKEAPVDGAEVTSLATRLVADVRVHPERLSLLDRFLTEYGLDSNEGVLLMCLAEALLRIPDAATVDDLIADKLGEGSWERHLGSEFLTVNASTWALMLTGRLLPPKDRDASHDGLLQHLAGRLGEPVVRGAVRHAMRILGQQFVIAEGIDDAMDAARQAAPGTCFSFDMLGEAALTAADAERYQGAYLRAIQAVAALNAGLPPGAPVNNVSVKLSALYPRFEVRHWQPAKDALCTRLRALAAVARNGNVPLSIDAEESDRTELGLAVFAKVLCGPGLNGWDGLGMVVQAYQKRAPELIDYLAGLARTSGHQIPVRLVKGAYWDSEIKQAQVDGLADYPVYTRKANTDVSYLACVDRLARCGAALNPQFATHNAHTVAWVTQRLGAAPFEFQRLFGMGAALYAGLARCGAARVPCRVYAPVGSYRELLPYLVRRLLENGANTSFVNRIADADIPVTEVVADPVAQVRDHLGAARHPKLPPPPRLYGRTRKNSRGLHLADRAAVAALRRAIAAFHATAPWSAVPDTPAMTGKGPRPVEVTSPSDGMPLGSVAFADADTALAALQVAHGAWQAWNARGARARARLLQRVADRLTAHRAELVGLCIREGGKTMVDAHAELREGVDFLRYYAAEARRHLGKERLLPGPVGEDNALHMHGRGVFLCISPWNFPLAIFTGQVAAALVTGNAVLAKPAEQTSLIAHRITSLMHEAGIPRDVLHCLPGDGPQLGAALLADERIAGVAFTGGTDTAQAVAAKLARRAGPIVPFIAETGGLNAMIVDSSALPEQVVRDVLQSAFGSAGQRCSALRMLYLQKDIADAVIALLGGAMNELVIGDPGELSTDVGPVIDAGALRQLQTHAGTARRDGRLIAQMPLPPAARQGHFFAPCLIEVPGIAALEREVFGPVLHLARFDIEALDAVCDAINASGYGLTFGIHSRIDYRIERVVERIRAGNVYVNRNMIGAVVGVQPFGGHGLSGTGPKAGGPNYLTRFCAEQTRTVNTAAVGGNASLLNL